MKKIVIAIACSSLIVLGCSKSNKSEPGSNSSTAPNANGGSAAAGPVDLKMKWPAGKQYDMQMDLNQMSDINVPGHPTHQVLKLTQGLNYSALKDLDNGGHEVELKFTHQNIGLTQNDKEILSFDTTHKTTIEPNSPGAPVAAAMNAMLDVPLTYTFAADGSVAKIDGIDSLSNSIAAAVPNQRERASLQQLYDEDTLKQYGEFSESLPDHPVSVGDSWSSSRDISTPTGVMSVKGNITFKDMEQHNGHNCAHLLISGDIKTKSASAAMTGAVVDVQKGTISGDAWFDPDLGMFVESSSDQDMTLNITTRGMAFSEHMKQNVAMSLISANP